MISHHVTHYASVSELNGQSGIHLNWKLTQKKVVKYPSNLSTKLPEMSLMLETVNLGRFQDYTHSQYSRSPADQCDGQPDISYI